MYLTYTQGYQSWMLSIEIIVIRGLVRILSSRLFEDKLFIQLFACHLILNKIKKK